jgi:trehalose synthase
MITAARVLHKRGVGSNVEDPQREEGDECYAGSDLQAQVIWNVNSTAKGGGVVEMLRPLLGYCRGAGVDARWAVISGGPEFFVITKRIHNRLHGFAGDGGPLGAAEHEIYDQTLAANVPELVELVRPRDVVILHDPQTAGLARVVREVGATVIWRCHVGLDGANDYARDAWSFLRGYVLDAHRFVFSRGGFAWDDLPRERVTVIHPSIDSKAGIVPRQDAGQPTFTRSDGSPGRVDRPAAMVQDEPIGAEDRLVVQVSRWDSLKDPLGVVGAYVKHVDRASGARLLLVGPSTEAVADDPEGAQVLSAVLEARAALPDQVRRLIHLASLPMDDTEENAAIVNAVQRTASVVIQKSLAEGFGLTVAEAMWKQRPVVASRIGGIRDQIEDGRSGVLISDPHDLKAVGEAVGGLLADRESAARMGAAAHASVQQHFLGPQHLGRYFEVIRRLAFERVSA